MQAHSAELENITRLPHTPICRGTVIDDGKVVHQLILTGGSTTSDRMAAQRTTMEFDIVDPGKEIDYEGLLFGKRIQIERGAVTSTVDTRAAFYGTTTSWVPSGTGELNGIKVDVDGSIVLGP